MTIFSKMLSQLFWIFIILALVVVYLRFMERRTLFYPMKEIEYLPKGFGLDFEDVFFKAPDNTELNGWFIPNPKARYTVLFCHGNAGNISHRLEKIKFFHDLGCNTFIFDYRGYGKSKGSPSEKGLYLDAQGAYNCLLARNITPDQIIGYGESIGGAAIIDLAYKNKIRGLISDSAPSSARDMIKVVYPYLPYWVFTLRLDSLSKISSITVPKLIIHSINDEIVPFKLGRKLFDHAVQPKEFLEVRGGHNSCFFESETLFKQKISEFLNKL